MRKNTTIHPTRGRIRTAATIAAMIMTALTAAAGPGISWLTTTIDFGAFHESDGAASATFKFVNTGDEPLVVTGARANCGCTTPRYPEEAIAPGDTAEISVTYDPAGRPGRFSKKVYVDTNTEPRRSTLTITGVVIGSPASLSGRYPVEAGPMRLAHPAALLGAIDRGHIKSVFEGAYNASSDTIRPTVSNVPKWLEVKPVPATVAPGEQLSFDFFVKSDKAPAWDIMTDTVTLSVTDAAGYLTSYRMPVVVTINEDFSKLSEKELSRAPKVRITTDGTIAAPDADGKLTFTISNDGATPLIVRRVYTTDPALTIDTTDGATIKPGKSLTVKVRADEAAVTRPRRANIVVVTNDPYTPKTSVAVGLGVR